MDACIDDELLAELLAGTVDEDLRKEVEAHIDTCSRCHATLAAFGRAFAESGPVVESLEPSEADSDVDAPAKLLPPGTVVAARFRVAEMVGAGGMGVVYRAHDPELGRDVALKLIRTGWFAGSQPAELRGRLIREARAMARVRHANVVAIFDVGEHEGGVFLAADFIEGRTLDAWVAAAERPPSEVLRVFLGAGEGLAAAHAAGIVHRDFKPTNVLVDARDVPYVTDFGLACAVESDDTHEYETTADLMIDGQVTRTGAFVGTPAYAAPEQLRGTPSPASDQFSFCVALYEALYGHRPFAGKTLLKRLAAIEEGRIEPASGSRRLHAAIVRGLAARPGARHPSMAALLQALRRAERSRLRRFAPAVALVTIASAAAIGYGVGDTESPPCGAFERRLDGVWDSAVRRELAAFAGKAEPAREAASFVEDALDHYAQEWVATATRACERSLVQLEQSEASYDLQLRCLTGRREGLRAVIDLVHALGPREAHRAVAAAQGLPPISQCEGLDPAQEAPPRDEEAAARVADADAKLAAAGVFARGGEAERARDLAAEALAAAQTAEHRPTQAKARIAIATRARHLVAPEAFENALFDAIAFAAEVGADRAQAEGLIVLAFVIGADEHRYDEGRRHAEIAQAILQRLDGTPDNADALNTMGAIENARGAPHEAKQLLERGLTVATDPATVHALLVNLAVAQFNLDDLEAATATTRRAYDRAAATLGALHPSTIAAKMNLASAYATAGKSEDALELFKQALADAQRRGPKEVGLRATALASIGMALDDLDRAAEGVPYLEQALALVREHRDEVTLRVDEVEAYLAGAYVSVGGESLAKGTALFAEALRHREAAVPEGHPSLAVVQANYGHALMQSDRCDEALPLLRLGLESLKKIHAADHPSVVNTQGNIDTCTQH